MNLEEQIRLHKSLSQQIEELETRKRELGATILAEMNGKTLRIGPYTVRRISRLSIKMSLDQARTLNATRLTETLDKDKIKDLHASGHPIAGVHIIEYIQILETHQSRLSDSAV